ncbi:hypothetical protein [Sphingopyxis flava]|uniref:Uncharacterized protein n=1 Tax=Sphingopyxis flava TaxID=1507287 RepID=A0A1T4ZVV0_9SPHN|nr:hypothetical protein [Sphingopyxis flava]SKB26832.1 hypothetical protein SAMN06295937_1001240 [Sphingopyxis flava]
MGASAIADRAASLTASAVPASQSGIPSAGWWHTQNEEYLHSRSDTREQAIDAGIAEYCGEPFLICQGERFKYQALHFDIDRIAEDFDDANYEYGPEDEGPSAAWGDEACRELERELTATMEAWLDRHGYRDAWAIDVRGYETIDAQAIEARRAATGTGAVHESAVAESDAPETSGEAGQ